jgi:hypothetical protein
MTNPVTEPIWSPDKKCLITTVSRPDGSVLTGEMFLENNKVSLVSTWGFPNAENRSTLITRNLGSTTEARKEFLSILAEFLANDTSDEVASE